jgi:glycosyltransferase involved in cell wall biosynthesis
VYRDHTVAAVVPAFNEEGFVGDVIEALPAFLDRAYVVDDGSTDGTWAEIERQAADRNENHDGHFERFVVPIRHDANRGVGGAIKTGYGRAVEEAIDVTVVLGGDGQMNPEELTKYIDPIVDGKAGYAKGNRFARPEDWAGMPPFRLLGNVILSYLTKIASGYWDLMDSQNGYAAISLDALRDTDIENMYEYYGYCNDLLVRLNVANVRVADVPRSADYAYSEGWKSHIDYREYIPRVSAMLLRSFWWRLRRKYLFQRYDPLGLLYVLGAGISSVGLAGLATTLVRRKGNGGSWFLSTIVGALVFVRATMLDRADNEPLAVTVDPSQTAASLEGEPSKPDPATPESDSDGSPAEARADGGSEDVAGES